MSTTESAIYRNVPGEGESDDVCAMSDATDVVMQATADYRGWGDYDLNRDIEDIGDEALAVVEALWARGWLNVDVILGDPDTRTDDGRLRR